MKLSRDIFIKLHA